MSSTLDAGGRRAVAVGHDLRLGHGWRGSRCPRRRRGSLARMPRHEPLAGRTSSWLQSRPRTRELDREAALGGEALLREVLEDDAQAGPASRACGAARSTSSACAESSRWSRGTSVTFRRPALTGPGSGRRPRDEDVATSGRAEQHASHVCTARRLGVDRGADGGSARGRWRGSCPGDGVSSRRQAAEEQQRGAEERQRPAPRRRRASAARRAASARRARASPSNAGLDGAPDARAPLAPPTRIWRAARRAPGSPPRRRRAARPRRA